jgi:hypothetical protein
MNIGKKTYSKMKETEEEHDILICTKPGKLGISILLVDFGTA